MKWFSPEFSEPTQQYPTLKHGSHFTGELPEKETNGITHQWNRVLYYVFCGWIICVSGGSILPVLWLDHMRQWWFYTTCDHMRPRDAWSVQAVKGFTGQV